MSIPAAPTFDAFPALIDYQSRLKARESNLLLSISGEAGLAKSPVVVPHSG
jgi:hypothetical protein